MLYYFNLVKNFAKYTLINFARQIISFFAYSKKQARKLAYWIKIWALLLLLAPNKISGTRSLPTILRNYNCGPKDPIIQIPNPFKNYMNLSDGNTEEFFSELENVFFKKYVNLSDENIEEFFSNLEKVYFTKYNFKDESDIKILKSAIALFKKIVIVRYAYEIEMVRAIRVREQFCGHKRHKNLFYYVMCSVCRFLKKNVDVIFKIADIEDSIIDFDYESEMFYFCTLFYHLKNEDLYKLLIYLFNGMVDNLIAKLEASFDLKNDVVTYNKVIYGLIEIRRLALEIKKYLKDGFNKITFKKNDSVRNLIIELAKLCLKNKKASLFKANESFSKEIIKNEIQAYEEIIESLKTK